MAEIRALAEQKQALILAHSYQDPEIYAVADYLGDSFELVKIGLQAKAKIIIFCGVRFMAEAVKILSPEKKVILPDSTAGCPLADSWPVRKLIALKKAYPRAVVVCYINSSTAVKAASKAVCTSANAVQIVKNLPQQEIIFGPDQNLGWQIRKQVPKKKIHLFPGACPVHAGITPVRVKRSRQQFPNAKVLAHGECLPAVQKLADKVCGTAGMLSFAQKSCAQEFIIATETNMVERLQREVPGKKFYPIGEKCCEMQKTTLTKVYQALKTETPVITIPKGLVRNARRSLAVMDF